MENVTITLSLSLARIAAAEMLNRRRSYLTRVDRALAYGRDPRAGDMERIETARAIEAIFRAALGEPLRPDEDMKPLGSGRF